MRLENLREAVTSAAQAMAQYGLVEFTAGNVSAVDRESGTVVITPGSMEYHLMRPDDIVLTDLEGQVLEGAHQPSSETQMHCAVYRERPDVGGIVHTHSPWATSFAVLGREIPPVHYVIYSIGDRIRTAPYATYGSQELATCAVETLGDDNAVLLQNHGVLAVGSDVRAALKNAIRVEFLAEVYWKSCQIGEPILLPSDELARVRARSAAKKHGASST